MTVAWLFHTLIWIRRRAKDNPIAPALFCQLDEIKRNQGGKIDRRRLVRDYLDFSRARV